MDLTKDINILRYAVTFVVLVTVFMTVCGDKTQVKDNENIVIGVIADGTPAEHGEDIHINGVDVTVLWHYIDITELYHVFKTIRELDDDSSVDVIILLDANRDITIYLNTILKTHNKQLFIWGDVYHEDNFQPNLQYRPGFFTDRTSCYDIRYENSICRNDTSPYHPNTNGHVGKTLYPGPKVLTKLVQYLKWKYVIILYQNETELEVTDTEDQLSENGVLFASFNIDRLGADIRYLYKRIYDFTLKTEDKINFLILCKTDCTKTILKEANDFDSKHNNKTVMKNLSRWLLGIYGETNTKCLESYANDLDHVVFVPIPEVTYDRKSEQGDFVKNITNAEFEQATCEEIMSDSKELFPRILRKCMFDFGFNTSMPTPIYKDNFIGEILQVSKEVNEHIRCPAYKIETLKWRTNGRDFGTVGYVEPSGDIIIMSDPFPNTKYGYNMREFLVSVIEYPPYVVKEKVNGTVQFSGFCLEILKELASTLNFTYKIIEPPDNSYGILDKETMMFTGIIGQLQKNEIDMAVADVAIQRDREQVMDFTYPFYFGYTTVMVRKPDPNQYKWMKLLEPFRWEVIVILFGTLFVAAFAVHFLEKHNPYYLKKAYKEQPDEHNCKEYGCGFHTYFGAVMWLFGILCNEGNLHMPGSITGRTFVSSWSLFCVVIIATYCGNLIAFLTITKTKVPFNSLRELAKLEGRYKWGLIGGTLWESVMTTSDLPEYKAIGDAIRRFNQTDPSILSKNQGYHLSRVANDETYAFIGDDAAIDIGISKDCDLVKIKERFLSLSNAFGFPDKSPHTKVISEQLMSMHESGLLAIWKRKWWPASSQCLGGASPQAKPIQLIDVQSAFYVLLIGIFVSSIVLVAECIIFRRRKRKEINQRSGGNASKIEMDSKD